MYVVRGKLDSIYVVNPYVVTNVIEQLDLQNPMDRGPRKSILPIYQKNVLYQSILPVGIW